MTHAKPQSSIFNGYVHPVAFVSAQNATTMRRDPSLVRDKRKLHSNLHSHDFLLTISDIYTHQCSNFVFLLIVYFFVCCMYTDIEAVSSMEAVVKWRVCVANGQLHQLTSLILTQIIPSNGRLV